MYMRIYLKSYMLILFMRGERDIHIDIHGTLSYVVHHMHGWNGLRSHAYRLGLGWLQRGA